MKRCPTLANKQFLRIFIYQFRTAKYSPYFTSLPTSGRFKGKTISQEPVADSTSSGRDT
jgi:hypothetical protein